MAEDRTRTSTVVNDFFGGVAKCTQRDSVRECIVAKGKVEECTQCVSIVFIFYWTNRVVVMNTVLSSGLRPNLK